ncbi:hypothetical protein [Paenimyroides aestuarii]|uniref:Uncharacterized protein n=1 Tax=Paenimyroides aestuarii TaxID=2968490 RepID=A0ABY5NVM8_9FLAO|nr:hypothetical protein [Paenimyroides aestuarii]UUV22487.1 hypothetical protein NPX36_05455 [Paenimyroides aestuarii]
MLLVLTTAFPDRPIDRVLDYTIKQLESSFMVQPIGMVGAII